MDSNFNMSILGGPVNQHLLIEESNGRISYVQEIQSMLFAFGDCPCPMIETAQLIEEICQQQMTEILVKCCDIAFMRQASTVGIEDILFLMRNSPVKVQRLIQYMSVMEILNSMKNNGSMGDLKPASTDSKRMNRCRQFLRQIDSHDSGFLCRAADQQLHDEAKLQRLRRLDRLSKDLDDRRYAEFTRARQVSFLGHKMKLSKKFNQWISQDISDGVDLLPLDRSAVEGLAYLAYETVGQLVDMSLQVRHDQETEDVVQRQMAPSVYNSMYQPQAADHCGSHPDEVADSTSVTQRPLEAKHIAEAMRRLTQLPRPMGLFSKSVKAASFPIIAI